METKGNYVLIGLFALVIMAVSFAYFYWSGRYQAATTQEAIELRVVGSANGLGPGSAVLFNGIRAGQVTGIAADPEDPNLVRVFARIDQFLPIKEDTRATVGTQGITGISVVNMTGGSLGAQRLLQTDNLNAVGVPVLEADATSDILAEAQQLTGQAGDILSGIDGLIRENRTDLNGIIDNVLGFTDALNSNSAELESFLRSAADVGRSLEGLAGTLRPAATRLENILAAVDPEKVAETTANVAAVTADLANASGRIDDILNEANQTASNLTRFSEALVRSGEQAEGVVAAIEPDQVATIIAQIEQAAQNVSKLTADLQPLTTTLAERSGEIDSVLSNAAQIGANVEAGTENLDELTGGLVEAAEAVATLGGDLSTTVGTLGGELEQVARDAQGILARTGSAVDEAQGALADVRVVVGDTGEIVRAFDPQVVSDASESIQAAADSARKTIESFEPLGDTVSARASDVDAIFLDLRGTLENVRAASARFDGLLDATENVIGSDATEGLVSEATAAARSFRQLADLLAVRSDSISANLNEFSGRGLADLQQLIRETQSAVRAFERAVTTIGDNPQRAIFGGSDVKEFGGRQRR
ncbi:MAG: MlaD family protein [Pseudomonadota bacterium]